jgi:hypothetical protein
MFELVAVNRLRVKEQESLRRFNEREEAVAEAERLRKEQPLTVFYVFVHLSWFCRLVTYHTL